ncbi:MAG: sigma-70 family RNA polymerase sigma factor [Acidobacteria bacterium]|nr:sigma-70 family RNA polymerase sigma factor [Acidobacteriota bacterium]
MNDARAVDADLVRRSSDGDTDAFRQLYEAKYRCIYLVAYQILGDQGQAEDVVQEAFVALWRHCGRYKSRFSVDTWLNRIATNKAIDRWRTERKHPTQFGDSEMLEGTAISGDSATSRATSGTVAADPSLRARWREVQAIWDELAADLSPQQRAAFVLRVLEERPVREVADVLGCGTSTVRSHIGLARKTLRAALENRRRARNSADTTEKVPSNGL